MKISLVTAVYNRAATVGAALDSVRAQRGVEVEHVIVDGGSTDATLAEVERRRHPGMRVLSEPDEGVYDALNKGIRMASGDVVGMVHSDDELAHVGVLAQVAEAFAASGADAVYGDLEYVSAADPSRVVRYWKSGAYHPGLLRRGWMPPHPTLFLRREVFAQHGLYDTSYRIAADYEAVLRYFGRGGISAAYVPEVLVRMRLGGESNRSLRQLLRKSREDFRALRATGMGGFGTLALKNFGKLPQFILRR